MNEYTTLIAVCGLVLGLILVIVLALFIFRHHAQLSGDVRFDVSLIEAGFKTEIARLEARLHGVETKTATAVEADASNAKGAVTSTLVAAERKI